MDTFAEYESAQGLGIQRSASFEGSRRGGTGKTLTLELKALREIYSAVDTDAAIRVLYLTHSWALMELVDQSLKTIDERGVAGTFLDVMPLTWLREH